MIPENLSTLKIHKLTQAQYERELKEGRIDPNAIYLTPDDNDESYFTVNETGETITGLTDTGKTQTELVIPYKINGVEITSIGNVAFDHCTSLTSINIPNSVTSISPSAFDGCTNLKIYCEQGSYADTYAKSNNIPVVYTAVNDIGSGVEIVDNLTTSDSTKALSANQGRVLKSQIDGKAHTSHASAATTYGVGTSTDYGHLKVADNLTTTTSGTALSANQGKVLNDFITKIENNTTLIKNSNGGFAAGTGAIAVDGVAIGSNAIQEEGGYDVGGVAIGSGASARMGVAIGTNATQSDIASTGGSLGLINGGAAIGKSAKALLGGAVGDKATSDNGGAVGEKATTTAGGAVGKEATSGNGGAVGKNATTDWGGAVGCDASAGYGGAVGSSASAARGGAVGYSAVAGYGFSGGNQAKCATVDDSVIDAIQLGSGTNSTERTLQVYDYQLMNASGNIPAERLGNLPIKSLAGQTVQPESGTTVTASTGATIIGDLRDREFYSNGNAKTGNIASGEYAIAMGAGATASGSHAIACGQMVKASGSTSVVLGYGGTASASSSVVAGQGNKATKAYAVSFGRACESNGTATLSHGDTSIANGDYAVAIGQNSTASGKWSTSLGYNSTASGNGSLSNGSTSVASGAYATSLGYHTKATGDYSLAIGQYVESTGSHSFSFGGYNGSTTDVTKATNTGSIALGINAKSSGMYAINIGGYDCDAAGMHSIVGGYGNTTKMLQTIFGQYANNKTAGTFGATTGDAFIIGNGTSEATSNAFRVSYAGGVYGIGTFKTTGADYAEYFEWLDGNTDNEDRRGRFVTLDGDKIRFATADDDYILGVVSAAPAIEGDNYDDDWQGKYLTDVFGTRLTQTVHYEAEYEEHEIIDPETGEKTVEKVLIHDEYDAEQWILNPDYDPTQEYVSREDRKEWSPIGFMGKLVVIDDGTCKVNGYCKAGENGIATKTTDKSGYRVMERIDDTHIKILVR